jgi:hypothetical protein
MSRERVSTRSAEAPVLAGVWLFVEAAPEAWGRVITISAAADHNLRICSGNERQNISTSPQNNVEKRSN